MEKPELNINLITFGKYKDKYLENILRDRKYCKWLLEQDWFLSGYEYLYNKVKEYNPQKYFIKDKEFENKEKMSIEEFLDNYKYFNLIDTDSLEIKLSPDDFLSYSFYLKMIDELKTRIKVRITKKDSNPFDIKAPSKWLQQFEKETNLKREQFKEFINAYDIPNITNVLEDIKKMGGIEYKGGKSFHIAKKRSNEQEEYWEKVLKEKYNEKIGTQFKYENCIFDFINISTNTIYECKLGLKDFNEEQYKKYLLALDKYNIIYLIGNDCVINMDMETIYTTDVKKYIIYQCNIPIMKNASKFDDIIFDYDIHEVDELNIVI